MLSFTISEFRILGFFTVVFQGRTNHTVVCYEKGDGVAGTEQLQVFKILLKGDPDSIFHTLTGYSSSPNFIFYGQLLEQNTIFWSIRTCQFFFCKFPTQCCFWHKLRCYFILCQPNTYFLWVSRKFQNKHVHAWKLNCSSKWLLRSHSIPKLYLIDDISAFLIPNHSVKFVYGA